MVAKLASKRARFLRERLSGEQNHRCCWCGVVTTFERGKSNSATIEHYPSLSEGGTHRWCDTAMACSRCNTSRQGTNPAYNSILPIDTKAGRRQQQLRYFIKGFKRTGNMETLRHMVTCCPCMPE